MRRAPRAIREELEDGEAEWTIVATGTVTNLFLAERRLTIHDATKKARALPRAKIEPFEASKIL